MKNQMQMSLLIGALMALTLMLTICVCPQAYAKDSPPSEVLLPDSGITEQPSPADPIVAEPQTVDQTVAAGKQFYDAIRGHRWREAAAVGLMVLIFLWRRFAAKLIIGKLSPWAVGFLTVLLGYLATIPQALTAQGFSWPAFIWGGLLTSSEAMLAWQMVGKKVLPKIFGDPQ